MLLSIQISIFKFQVCYYVYYVIMNKFILLNIISLLFTIDGMKKTPYNSKYSIDIHGLHAMPVIVFEDNLL